MAGKNGLQKRLHSEIVRRKNNPRPRAVETGNVRSDRWHEITEHHADILQNIEVTLIASFQQRHQIDDLALHRALKAALLNVPSDDQLSNEVFESLVAMRMIRQDVDPELWHDALRVVDQSVRDHSSLRPGDCAYIAFTLPYLAPALN